MPTRRKSPATYEDIEALPTGWVGEIVAGTLYGHPRPATGHARAASILGHVLLGPFDQGVNGPGGWYFLYEPELHFGSDVLVPDLAAWRKERMPNPPDPHTPYLTLAPDWICEILSPSTEVVDRARKLPRYHEVGVSHAWVIDPLERTLEVLERHDRGWLLTGTYGEHAEVRASPFQELLLPLASLWT
ncbi:MAG TPA: Uma2 family endonuclease [Myxococcaceae bacterium]|nr:Uma2 family endonuclease [Myxococcaceae bacterium]